MIIKAVELLLSLTVVGRQRHMLQSYTYCEPASLPCCSKHDTEKNVDKAGDKADDAARDAKGTAKDAKKDVKKSL